MKTAAVEMPPDPLDSESAPIQRLLMVADSAVALVDDLPTAVRALIVAAAEVYVVTPTLPGRLAWLTDDIDRLRHLADERLDTVLGHIHAISPEARGRTGDEMLLTSFDDAVGDFQPDHILIGLRSSEHGNWQERGLLEQVKERFGLPVTTYAIDLQGHVTLSVPD